MAGDNLSMEEKINVIFNKMNQLDVITSSIAKIETALGTQKVKVAKLENAVEELNKEVLNLKNIVN